MWCIMQLLCSRNTGFQWITFSNPELFCCINFWTFTSVSQVHIVGITNTGLVYIFHITSSDLYIFCITSFEPVCSISDVS
jgi:hypothetical protein